MPYIHSRSVEGVKKLFHKMFDDTPQWAAYVPFDPTKSPSSSSFAPIYGDRLDECLGYLPMIKDRMDWVFGQVTINENRWEILLNEANFSHEGMLRKYGRLSRLTDGSEMELRHVLLGPLLSELAHEVSYIPKSEDLDSYISRLSVEHPTDSRKKAGPKCSVDYLFRGHDKSGELNLYVLPAEVKLFMKIKDALQLSDYMSRLSFSPSLKGRAMAGLLMDKTHFRIAFSVFQDDEGVPLPIIMMGPAIQYIHHNIISLVADPLFMLSSLLMFNMQRTTLNVEEFTESESRYIYDFTTTPPLLLLNEDILTSNEYLLRSIQKQIDELRNKKSLS